MRQALYIFFVLILFSCSEDEGGNLPSADERKKEAIDELTDELTSVLNGWRLQYRPTPESGSYFMLLDFNTDGTVNIKSDISDNNGEFVDHTISYRIDAALGLELIFETYGVFHYLFEKDRATFGAEFEFLYLEKIGNDIFFQSISDFVNPTILKLEPANVSDVDLFSLDLSKNLVAFDSLSPQIFGGIPPIHQVILEDKNISIFWGIDLTRRIIDVDIAAVGKTMEEININEMSVSIGHTTGYTLLGGKIVLDEGFSFELNGIDVSVTEITLTNFSITGPSFCVLNSVPTPVYTGNIPGVGATTVKKSLFDSDGLDFQPMEDTPYSVNVLYAFDEKGFSLFQSGVIGEKFPNATGLAFNYGLIFENQPVNAVGFYLEDEFGNPLTYLREFNVTERVGNKISITLLNSYYYSATPAVGAEQSLTEITDLIFEGNDMYIYKLPADDITVFWLFNPCNSYEVFLVQ